MLQSDLFYNIDFVNSWIEDFSYSEELSQLICQISLCNWLQNDYLSESPEIISGVLTFKKIQHISFDPFPLFIEKNEVDGAEIIGCEVLSEIIEDLVKVKLVLNLTTAVIKNSVYVITISAQNVDWQSSTDG